MIKQFYDTDDIQTFEVDVPLYIRIEAAVQNRIYQQNAKRSIELGQTKKTMWINQYFLCN